MKKFYINLNENIVSKKYLIITQKNLIEIFNKASFYVVKSLVKKQTYSTYVGSSMPMTNKPFLNNHIDIFGVPKNWENLHIVDASILSSLPATPIGLLIATNTMRIASNIKINNI